MPVLTTEQVQGLDPYAFLAVPGKHGPADRLRPGETPVSGHRPRSRTPAWASWSRHSRGRAHGGGRRGAGQLAHDDRAQVLASAAGRRGFPHRGLVDHEDTFVTALLGSLGSYPPYFLLLGEINRRGPAVLSGVGIPVLPVSTVQQSRADGALVIDVRPVADYAAAHVPSRASIPLRARFATWLGWLIPPDTPLVILRNPGQDLDDVVWQALNIGHDRLAGELAGGIDAWTAAGQPTACTELITPDRIGYRHVLDIRQRPEFTAGHLPGAVHVELGDIAETADRLPTGPTVVMCGHGERAAGAASLLERAGHRHLAVLVGGPDDGATVTGNRLRTGP